MGGARGVPIAVALVAVLVYAVSLGGEFVLDDHLAVEGSACVTGSLDVSAVFGRNFWCQPPGAETIDSWRPIPVLGWRAAWQVGGGSPWPFHLLSVLLHAVVSGLVVVLARQWFPQPGRCGLWAGLAFAVLPIHAEAVASIVGVAELWAAAFGVFAIFAVSRGGRRWWVLSGLALAGALLSKESAVVVSVMLLVVAWSGDAPRNDKVGLTVSVVALTVGFLVVRGDVLGSWLGTHVTPTVNPLVEAPPWLRLPMALSLLGRYLALAAVGYPLSADYSVEQIPVEPLSAYLVLGAAAGLGLVVWTWRNRDDPGTVRCAVWFLGAAALAVNLVALLPAIFAERLFYAPSIPLCVLLGVGIARLVEDRGRRGAVLGGSVVLLWGVAAAQHAWRWTTEDRITEVTAEHCPDSARAHVWRARVLGRAGDSEGMRFHAEAATRILPTWATPRALLAAALDAEGDPEAALPLFRSALEQDPANPEIADLFVQFLLRYGHTQLAQVVYARHADANGGTAAPSVTRP